MIAAIPVLQTERLRLRAPRLEDFAPFAAHCASDRATFSTGRLDRKGAWAEFASAAGSWTLLGFGAWSVEDRATGTYLGEIMIQHPAHFPEPELGWTLMEHAEGRGYATEAARAALDWAKGRVASLVSYITPGNARSVALAERLGAVLDMGAALPDGEGPDETIVYRHRGIA
ncbi:GNAT family N-acetyltransferase [Rhodobacterales bacterium HKCCE3408]|nr:GNAT family N-acetyltransferase [Rhodobacterales bacterium HKCCE3408]